MTDADLIEIFRMKYGYPKPPGPNPRLWLRYGYFLPDEYYEATVAKLVNPKTRWLDVGCGREIFPQNPTLAELLSKRCARLVGLDPDANIKENRWVHERFRGMLEDYHSAEKFNLVTLRMVAEHIADPRALVTSLAHLTEIASKVVVYTVHHWSPAALAARLVPFRLHHSVKKLLWGTAERDTFPVTYQMNTRQRLAEVFREGGFEEISYTSLADCRVFARYRTLHLLEISLWRTLLLVGLGYPERCVLGVYQRQP